MSVDGTSHKENTEGQESKQYLKTSSITILEYIGHEYRKAEIHGNLGLKNCVVNIQSDLQNLFDKMTFGNVVCGLLHRSIFC